MPDVEEIQTESAVSEPTVEPTPVPAPELTTEPPFPESVIETPVAESAIPGPIPEPRNPEPAPTAQPIEPLNSGPETIPQPFSSAEPESVTELTPVAESVLEESVSTPESEPISEPAPQYQPTPLETASSQANPVSNETSQPTHSPSPTVKKNEQPQIKEVFVYKPTKEMMQALQKISLVAIQKRIRKKIEKIMTLFEKRPEITTTEVQMLLIVSHNTAIRYMNVLEKEGRVRQIGRKGSSVHYIKT